MVNFTIFLLNVLDPNLFLNFFPFIFWKVLNIKLYKCGFRPFTGCSFVLLERVFRPSKAKPSTKVCAKFQFDMPNRSWEGGGCFKPPPQKKHTHKESLGLRSLDLGCNDDCLNTVGNSSKPNNVRKTSIIVSFGTNSRKLIFSIA